MAPCLPTELLKMIVDEVPTEELGNIRAASQTFCALATPRLFRTLRVTSTLESADSLANVVRSPEVAPYVKEVVFCNRGAAADGRVVPVEGDPRPGDIDSAIIDALGDAFSLIHELPSLRSLTLTFWHPDWPHQPAATAATADDDEGGIDGYMFLPKEILTAITDSSEMLSQKLRALTINNLMAYNDPSQYTTQFGRLFANLESVRLTVVSSNDPSFIDDMEEAIWDNFWSDFISGTVLRSLEDLPSGSLTSLTLHNPHHLYEPPVFVPWSDVTLPLLSSLSLLGFDFEGIPYLEDFIVRHAGTLVRLELLHCVMETDREPHMDEAMLAQLIEDSEHRSWVSVWDTLALEMTVLMELVVEDAPFDGPYEPGPDAPLVVRYREAQIPHHPLSFDDEDEDVRALDRFRAVVKSRGGVA
ncbi:hypothetical protein BV25DRAFT_924586 [Artomyces pyxidatus]|uniref:Uncharacterized protein n=1 Tax=Artomyces pyxidatus TaxID=48021 RepID=A0ACB8SX36_9AGAM|nr:hypothetical protein BV25DRAFT_924586 [Artomyces pyxidatus]